MVSFVKPQAAKSMVSNVHPLPVTERLSHLRDIVKACVFYRVKDLRKGADDLQVTVAIASPLYDLEENYGDIRCLIDEAIADAIAFLPDVAPSDAATTAVIEGAIEGIELTKRQAILKAHAEIRKIQSYIDDQEQEIQQLNHCILTHLQSNSFKASLHPGSRLSNQE